MPRMRLRTPESYDHATEEDGQGFVQRTFVLRQGERFISPDTGEPFNGPGTAIVYYWPDRVSATFVVSPKRESTVEEE